MGWAYSTLGRNGRCIQNFSRKTRREETLVRSTHSWENNIKMGLKERDYEVVDWIHLAQWSVAGLFNTAMSLRIP
jgi:hypothetical protein